MLLATVGICRASERSSNNIPDEYLRNVASTLAFSGDTVRWGGEGIVITVGRGSTSLQFGCASGFISGGIKPVRGKFKANGTYTPSSSIATAGRSRSIEIRVEGQIRGKSMTLKIFNVENDSVIGNYSLERGKAVRLSRCA